MGCGAIDALTTKTFFFCLDFFLRFCFCGNARGAGDGTRDKFKSERTETRRDEFGRDVPVSPPSAASGRNRSRSPPRNRSRSPPTRHRSRSPAPLQRSRGEEWGTEFAGGSRSMPPPRGMDPGRAALLGLGPPPFVYGHPSQPVPPHYVLQQHPAYNVMMPYGDPSRASGPPPPPSSSSSDRPRYGGGGGGGISSNSSGSAHSESRSRSSGSSTSSSSSSRAGGSYRGRGGGGGSGAADARPTRPHWTELPTLRSFRQFVLTQEGGIDNDEAQRRYDVYKGEFTERINKQFFETHKDDEWFLNKYHPEHRGARRAELASRSRLAALQFGERLRGGTLRWRLDADHADNAVFAPFLEHDNAQVRSHSELLLTAAAADARAAALAAADAGGEALDDAAAKRALDAAGAAYSRDMERRTVYVKALPSATTRGVLDATFRAVGEVERLALSEPSIERMNRRAWVTYATFEAAQRAAEELSGATLVLANGQITRLSLQLLSPHRVRVRVVPPALSLPDRIAHDAAVARRLVEKLDREKRLWPPTAADAEDDDGRDGDASGDDGGAVGGKRALVPSKRQALERHPLLSDAAFEKRPVEEQLDLLVAYLRRVHFYCYYTAAEFDSDIDLERARGPIHLRFGSKRALEVVQQRAAATAAVAAAAAAATAADGAAPEITAPTLPGVPEADVKWMKSLDERNEARLAYADLADASTAAALLKQQLVELVENNSEPVDDLGKHQCKVCPNKVFKEKVFVEKHIFNKHQDMVDQVRLAAFIEQSRLNFLADPMRLRPEERGVEETGAGSGVGSGGSAAQSGTRGGRFATNNRLGPRQPLPPPPGAKFDPRARNAPRVYTDLDQPAKTTQIDYGFD